MKKTPKAETSPGAMTALRLLAQWNPLGDHDVERDDAQLRGDQHRRHHEGQQRTAATEAQLGEGKAGHGRGEDDGERHDRRDDRRIQQGESEVAFPEGVLDVHPELIARSQGWRVSADLRGVAGGDDERPVEREGRDEDQNDEQGIGEPGGVTGAAALSHVSPLRRSGAREGD
ncbi:hypothetical protein [Nostocoides vanveenii]|uniref:hypothetical protein n=1 Tax=Nostocoides vanveenii TaxID=330835 RepID=UPI0031E327E8